MASTGDGKFPIVSAWGRGRGRGNASLFIKQQSSSILPVVMTDYLLGIANSNPVYNESFTETLTASDALGVTRTTEPVFTDTLAVSDTNAGALNISTTLSESTVLTDSVTASFLYTAAFTDSIAASDSGAATVTFTIAQTETLAGSDTQAAQATYNPAISESATAGDTQAAAATYGAALTESLAGSDSNAGQAVYNPVLSESLTADYTETDSQSGGGGGTTYNETIEELLTAEDGLSYQYIEGDVRGTPTFHWIFPQKEKQKKIEEELQEIEEQITPKTVYSAEQMLADTIELQQLIKRKNELEAELFALKAKRRRNNNAITAIVLASPFVRIAA